ncbi:hypothetical protein SASPL_108241 [Salvia splendens]|uniref:Mitogen-activated protein kinase n=2 Tax=Salvia splendens TaxID=180675 RepID=A0A8X8YEY9_SALSN|nr:hypothetical protein SASPL_108241 [Salvia splendens]
MSRPQEPHRPFLPFGNPFRRMSPKGSYLSPKLLALLNTFEETLQGRINNLRPVGRDDVLRLSWMRFGMDTLCEIHTDVKTLITALELPVCDWDDKWIDVYLDDSVKLLDICIAFSSEISQLKQGHLFLQCVLHNFGGAPTKQFERARSSLEGWKEHVAKKNPRFDNCFCAMDVLAEKLDLPKIKNSAKGNILMRAMYGVKVVSLLVCSIFAAAFSGSTKKLMDIQVPESFSWAAAFSELQAFVNTEIRSLHSSGRTTILKELEAVDTDVKKLYPIVQEEENLVEAQVLVSSTSDLGKSAGKLSQGLDLLAKDVDRFFQIVLTGRDTLLGNLRIGGNASDGVRRVNFKGGPLHRLVLANFICFLLFGMSVESSSGSGDHGGHNIKGVVTHGGRYMQYNVHENLFEVSRKYVPFKPVGRGAYGIVCAAVNSETREEVAIKKIGNAFDNIIDARRTLREIKLLRHMNHDNVIAIKDIIRPPQKENFNDVYIVYELMDTDLHQIIHSNQTLTDDHCRYFLYQILRGLKYVHSANVLHRDLKPSNLLLNANCDLKIGDFGLARTTSETDFMTEYVVTRWYRAPELLLNCSEYTAAIDIWSVGCIFGEIMTRKPLFPGKDYVHQLRLITQLVGSPDDASLGFLRSDNARRYVRQLPQYVKQQFPSRFPNTSAGALDLLEKMLVFDPSKRITANEALCHPYLAPLHDINEEPACPRPFVFDFELPSFTEENIKELIWRESVKFNPDPAH